ncbi:hypothetical protein QJU89_07695 [Pasteurella skyensis]|uniref:Knr4/Smi1-like domain-containing protein n=1 Tax=Phocoenobacter skyensis TaxID=97481 RepID=A0AAJ6P2Y0_9PAST|nr:SMI1/KNR4 family protein [Pasteurella skyensis]MDP8162964.1 hypothetical protein [Pasteurella skyensis]MDP8170927.1 hypothetical protein [Pasteurella skyensis]MDP8172884.1 hypothetical protein [Pasteurella skyensis]MDP8175173.1 hypothetical protein [Pasteurella skyensis]MDP8176670.1 hypothetical protein [Pasteurella skyensis]
MKEITDLINKLIVHTKDNPLIVNGKSIQVLQKRKITFDEINDFEEAYNIIVPCELKELWRCCGHFEVLGDMTFEIIPPNQIMSFSNELFEQLELDLFPNTLYVISEIALGTGFGLYDITNQDSPNFAVTYADIFCENWQEEVIMTTLFEWIDEYFSLFWTKEYNVIFEEKLG